MQRAHRESKKCVCVCVCQAELCPMVSVEPRSDLDIMLRTVFMAGIYSDHTENLWHYRSVIYSHAWRPWTIPCGSQISLNCGSDTAAAGHTTYYCCTHFHAFSTYPFKSCMAAVCALGQAHRLAAVQQNGYMSNVTFHWGKCRVRVFRGN